MLAWLFSMVLFGIAMWGNGPMLLNHDIYRGCIMLASGLFAIAGNISLGFTIKIKEEMK